MNVKTSIFDQSLNSDTWNSGIASVSLEKGGQFGFLPMIGGIDNEKNISEYMYNQSYLRKDLIAIVLDTPKVFDYLPNPDNWRKAIKAFFEVHAKTIDGIDSSLTVDTNEKETGLSGGKFKEPTNVTRADTNVSIGITEKYGIPFEILLDVWIRYGIMDPDTKSPLATTLPGMEDVNIYSPEFWTCTVLFIEPDVLLRKATHGWFVGNLFPTSNPDIVGKKDKTAGRELKDMTVEMGGLAIPSTNKRVMDLANTVLDSLKLYTRTPDDILLPATEVAANLKGKSPADIYYESTGASLYEGTNPTTNEAT